MRDWHYRPHRSRIRRTLSTVHMLLIGGLVLATTVMGLIDQGWRLIAFLQP